LSKLSGHLGAPISPGFCGSWEWWDGSTLVIFRI